MAEAEGKGAPALCHEQVAHEADSEWGGPVGAVAGERPAVRRVWRQCYWAMSAVASCFLSFVAFLLDIFRNCVEFIHQLAPSF